MFALDASWNAQVVTLPSGALLRFHERKESNPSESDTLIEKYLHGVVAEGGALFRRFGDTPNLKPTAAAPGVLGYTSDPPDVRVWYVPKCSFEHSFELLDVVEFPKPGIRSNAESVRKATKALVKELAQERQLAPTAIGPEHLSYEIIKGASFSPDEVNHVLDFNAENFNVSRENWELRDYRRLFRTKGFVVIGAL